MALAAVSTTCTAFIALPWNVMGVIKNDGEEMWQTVKSPVVFSTCLLLGSHQRLLDGFQTVYGWTSCRRLRDWNRR